MLDESFDFIHRNFISMLILNFIASLGFLFQIFKRDYTCLKHILFEFYEYQMYRLLDIHTIFYILFFLLILFVPIDAAKKRSYTTGIAEIVRNAFRRSLNRLIFRQTSYDSDVFRYTQLSKYGATGLYAGESCRLTSTWCSHDAQCCSGRCLCRRWTITGEERCIRKCF